MECWGVGVLRQVRIAPRGRGVGDPFGAILGVVPPGVKTPGLSPDVPSGQGLPATYLSPITFH